MLELAILIGFMERALPDKASSLFTIANNSFREKYPIHIRLARLKQKEGSKYCRRFIGQTVNANNLIFLISNHTPLLLKRDGIDR